MYTDYGFDQERDALMRTPRTLPSADIASVGLAASHPWLVDDYFNSRYGQRPFPCILFVACQYLKHYNTEHAKMLASLRSWGDITISAKLRLYAQSHRVRL